MRELQLSWSSSKAEANLAKHGIAFEEAAEALEDPLAVVRFDAEHSKQEDRFVLVGESPTARILTVIFTVRGESARIISARKSTSAERRRYMEDESGIRDAPGSDDDMLDDYGQLEGWRRNPFRFRKAEGVIILDPDVSSVFRTSEEVNAALRELISKRRTPADRRSS